MDEPSPRSNTTIVFGSVTPSGILTAFVFSPRAIADKSAAITTRIKTKTHFKLFLP